MIDKRCIKIGGEFEIDPKSIIGYNNYVSEPRQYLFSSGRSALQAILFFLKKNKPTKIYIPYYICKSVFTTCFNMGYKIEFYELTDNYTFPIELLSKFEKHSIILLVNYFGFVNLEATIKTIKKNRADIITIYDNVQSFWTYDETCADFSFTSLRKHFAVPDGALLNSNYQGFTIDMNIKTNSFYQSKFIGSLLKKEQADDNLYLHFFNEGEQALNEEKEITKSSRLAQYCYSNMNFEKIKKSRLKNTELVYKIGRAFGLNFMFEYSENIIPLVVPIQVNDRNKVRKRLYDKKIFLPVHWPIEEIAFSTEKTRKIAASELSLIVDQRYSEEAITYQMKELISNI